MSITPIDIGIARTRPARVLKDPRESAAHSASDVVQWFLDYYWIRHPISNESIAAYRVELATLEFWLTANRSKSLVNASDKDLRAFLDARYRVDCRTPGDVPSFSCIKRFYFYLVESGLRADDPTEHLYVRTPRILKTNLTVIPGKRN